MIEKAKNVRKENSISLAELSARTGLKKDDFPNREDRLLSYFERFHQVPEWVRAGINIRKD